jgi:small GTP-binding protein
VIFADPWKFERVSVVSELSSMSHGLDGVDFYTFKFIIIGDSAVGKSCIVSRFCDGQFSSSHDTTIGVSFSSQTMHIGTAELKLQLWDTAGQEIYRSITRSYYRDSHCAILVCDLTKHDTFTSLLGWVKDVQALAPPNCKIVLVGNKADLDREVPVESLRTLAEQIECPFFETSARTGQNINPLFEECAMLVYTAVTQERSLRTKLEEQPPPRSDLVQKDKQQCC